MKVLLMSRYGRMGGSSRIRSYQYLPYLEREGIEVTAAPLLEDRYLENLYAGRRNSPGDLVRAFARRVRELLGSRRFDLVWVEKELFPWLPAWAEEVFSWIGIRFAAEYDDAVFHRYDLHRSGLVRGFLGSKIDRVMRHASLVIAGNSYLRGRALAAGAARAECIPSTVDLERYAPVRPAKRQHPVIGWIGSPTTARYLHQAAPALAAVCRQHGARVVLVGAGRIELPGVPVEIQPWTEQTEVEAILGMDIGIMPLEDGPWERGKCGYKLVQYMACGLPVVASPVGVNVEIVSHGAEGFLVDSEPGWRESLAALIASRALRHRLGGEGRAKVERLYSVQVQAPRLARLLRCAAGKQ